MVGAYPLEVQPLEMTGQFPKRHTSPPELTTVRQEDWNRNLEN